MHQCRRRRSPSPLGRLLKVRAFGSLPPPDGVGRLTHAHAVPVGRLLAGNQSLRYVARCAKLVLVAREATAQVNMTDRKDMEPNKLIGITVGQLMDLQMTQDAQKRADLVSAISKQNEKIMGDTRPWLLIPVPRVAPFGEPADKRSFLQDVWDTFIKPSQEAGNPQSIEERILMAVLRAVYEGLPEEEVAS